MFRFVRKKYNYISFLVRMSDLSDGRGKKRCFHCKNPVVNSTNCEGCNAPYHPSSALKRSTSIGNIYKCCTLSMPISPNSNSGINFEINTPIVGNSSNTEVEHNLLSASNNTSIADRSNEDINKVLASVRQLNTSKFDSVFTRLGNVDSRLDAIRVLSDRMDKIDSRLTVLEVDRNNNTNTEEATAEILDRLSRQRNIIICNYKKSNIGSQIKNDFIINILKTTDNIDVTNYKDEKTWQNFCKW